MAGREGRGGLAPEAAASAGTALFRYLLAAGVVLTAFNLRPVFSSASALLPEIMQTTGLSDFGAGALTTAPVFCLGLFAPVAPRLAGRFGIERVLLALLALLAVGTALRGFGTVPLFVGTIIAGACIAVGNVLLPGVVKRDFAERTALMTGLYTMAVCGGAAVAAGVTVPLYKALGSWQSALAAWALPAAVVAVLWLPQVAHARKRARPGRLSVVGLWRDPLAWQVTLFMGLQSTLAYCVFGWLAPLLRFRGLDAVTAGAVVSVSVMAQVATCLITPAIAVRCRDQRAINVTLALLAGGALAAFVFAPLSLVWLLAIVQGIGQGGLIAIAITMIVLRSPDSHVAAHLSGMAQSVGYLLAAIGPFLVGLLRGATGDFNAAAVYFGLVALALATAGLGAGRALHVAARPVPGD